MTQNQIASLSLKVLGIYSIIESIPLLRELSQVFAWRSSQIEMENGTFNANLLLIGIITSVGLLALIGSCLIIFSKFFAKRMIHEEEEINAHTELSAKNIQAVAFSIVGLVMIVIAIPHLVQLAANLQALKSAGSGSVRKDISIGTWAFSISVAVQFIIGVLLFWGGKGLSSIWYAIQKTRPMKGI